MIWADYRDFAIVMLLAGLKLWDLSLSGKLREVMKSGIVRQREGILLFRIIQGICQKVPYGQYSGTADISPEEFLGT